MIELRKRVYRRTVGESKTLKGKIIIGLEPGDIISIRVKGRRKVWTASIDWVALQILKRNCLPIPIRKETLS